MEARINLFILVCLAGLASIGFAQEATVPVGDTNVVTIPAFPYVAEITGNDVYIRSGPGTNHYFTGKLNKGDRVTVVGSQFSWSRIVPPAGSFSWISARYVRVDPNNPSAGVVTGNALRVYVGADDRDPIRSARWQLKLDRGEEVTLLGERKIDYYKIAPPTGAYRWVSAKYTKPIVDVRPTPPTPPTPPPPAATPVRTSAAVEAEKLREYYALQKQVEAERVKPIGQQNYASIKKALAAIAANKQAGKAARYSQFSIKQVERFELALEVGKIVKLEDAQLRKTKNDIARERAARLAELRRLGRFAVIGRLKISTVYVEATYQVVDDSGKNVCYALPASKMDLTKLVGRKVGLVGKIEPHRQTGGALVRFTEAVPLK
ncbi:MAG: SH3 domain-containing protein [Planctomycetota bacterium]|jgi:hypothetical protein